jgi:VPDSG-CTERM motif
VKWIDAVPDGKKDKRPYSVPDAGFTAALLGVSVALIALARRKIAKSGAIF